MKYLIALAFFFLFNGATYAQKDWIYTPYFSFGLNVNLNYGKKQTFPGVNLYGGFAVSAVFKNSFIANYGGSVSLYRKTVGTNLNPLIDNIEIDFTNSISAGYGGNPLSYRKLIRTMQNSAFYNINLNNNYFGLLSTNIVLNNHRRNQVVGSLTLSGPGLSFNYYNDGAAPVKWLGIGDGFDRWWTGGGSFFVHSRRGFNYGELSFDQFTGYQPFLFELSEIIGIDVPPYTQSADAQSKRKKDSNYNSSQYHLRIGLNEHFSIDAGVLGSLRVGENGTIFSFQDLIHVVGKMPLHPNNDVNRFFIGGSFNDINYVKVK
ncbi:hypothetical protein [Pedobacter sp.]|uniref:hypothetical protein n=1 Tax=Pedobacter sp. TaxID=1411316 RepID=UPI0031CF24DB